MTNKILNKIKSNPHIKVINPNLWTVNFDYVLNGWIKEIKFHNTDSNSFIALADNVIILNSSKSSCENMIPILESIMKLPNNKIGKRESFCSWARTDMPSLKNNTNEEIMNFIIGKGFDYVIKLYLQLSELERQRRKI